MPTRTMILSDMSRCAPASALSAAAARNHWHLIPYETGNFRGAMIGSLSSNAAPPVTLPLGVAGWHAVYAGFWNPHHAYDGGVKVKLKLAGDPCFQSIAEPEPALHFAASELKEAFFKYADLTGQDLIIAQQTQGVWKRAAYLAYIKLVPLTPEQVAAIENDRAQTHTRRLVATNDGNGLFYLGPTTAEDLLEEIEPYRHSDVGTVLFAFASGDTVNHPSRIGHRWGEGRRPDAAITDAHRGVYESLETLLARGIVPGRVIEEHTHRLGLQFHAMFRLGLIGDLPPSDLFGDGLVRRRPELRMLARDGTPMEKASYAFPEVRDHMLALIREVAETFRIDGINLGFIRGPQWVGYETPVVEAFQKTHGEDPRRLDPNDPRLQRHRAGYLTTFIREARQLVNEISRRQGRRIELSAWPGCYGTLECQLFYGFDVETWLQERLLDTLIVDARDPAWLARIKASGCRLLIEVGGHTPQETATTIARAYAAGADGFVQWDMNTYQERPEFWDVLRRAGHRAEIEALAKSPQPLATLPLKTVGGFDISHVTNEGADARKFRPPEMLPMYSGG